MTGVERWQMIPALRNELTKKAPYESLFTILLVMKLVCLRIQIAYAEPVAFHQGKVHW